MARCESRMVPNKTLGNIPTSISEIIPPRHRFGCPALGRALPQLPLGPLIKPNTSLSYKVYLIYRGTLYQHFNDIFHPKLANIMNKYIYT